MSHFDVNDTEPRVQYTATAGQTAFAIPFEFIANTDILVYQTLSGATPDDATDILILTTHYTLTGAGVTGGGTMTLVTGAAVNDTITIARDMAIQRKDTDYQDNGDFLAETVNTDIDRAILGIQQLESTINNRMLKLQRSTNTSGLDTTIPSPVAGKVIGFNGTADAIVLHDSPATLAGAAYTSETQTATASQTVFTLLNISYTPGIRNLSVYINGVRQSTTAYAETDANTVTFTAGLDAGDEVQFVSSDVVSNTSSNADTTTYDQGGAGSVATNVGAKLREVISVKDFGAVGNGFTDDSPAIQAAIDAVSAAGGGTVYFPAGTYYKLSTSTPLLPKDNVRLLGAGMGSTILYLDDQGSNGYFQTGTTPSDGCVNFGIENLTFKGSWAETTANTESKSLFVAYYITNFYLTNVEFCYSRYIGCVARNCDGVTVTGCYFHHTNADGIAAWDSKDVRIIGNNFEANDDNCISCHTNDSMTVPLRTGVIIQGNTMESTAGLSVLGAKETIITGNVMRRISGLGMIVDVGDAVFNQGDTPHYSVNISDNIISDVYLRNAGNAEQYYIRIGGGTQQAGTLAAAPGRNDTGTSDIIDLFGSTTGHFMAQNVDDDATMPSPGGYHIIIKNNILARTLPAVTNFSDWGYGQWFSGENGTGYSDHQVNESDLNTNGIKIMPTSMNRVLIEGNVISTTGNYGILFNTGTTPAALLYDDLTIRNNKISDFLLAGIQWAATTASSQVIRIIGNEINGDPRFVAANREATKNGTWTSSGSPTAIYFANCHGIYASDNHIKNVNTPIQFSSNTNNTGHNNVLYCDPLVIGFNTTNVGIGTVPSAGPEYNYVIDECDPSQATYGEIKSITLLQSSSIPTTGKYVRGHFVRNTTPSIDGNNMILLGWARLTTGTAHVSNTDWGLCYASTVSPAT